MSELTTKDFDIYVLGGSVLVQGLAPGNDSITFPQDRQENTYRVGPQGDVAIFGAPGRVVGEVGILLLPESPTIAPLKSSSNGPEGAVVNRDITIRNRRTNHQAYARRGHPFQFPAFFNLGDEVDNLRFTWIYAEVDGDWSSVITVT